MVAPVLVTVDPARTTKLDAVPSEGAVSDRSGAALTTAGGQGRPEQNRAREHRSKN